MPYHGETIFYSKDSSSETWADSVVGGLPLNRSGPVQWTPYTRRRLIRWTKSKFIFIIYLGQIKGHVRNTLKRSCYFY